MKLIESGEDKIHQDCKKQKEEKKITKQYNMGKENYAIQYTKIDR